MSVTPSGCPKNMTYGPCGGVLADGSCEVDDRRCPFLDRSTTAWAGAPLRPRDVDVPRVVVDHRPTGDDALDREILIGYRELGVGVLLGDHLDDPVSVDRLTTAQRTTETGVTTIATITGRTRSGEERSRLIGGFVDAGVAAVLCVTGDHPAARDRPDERVEFVSEGTVLANEARRLGAVVGVAESPAAPPHARRSARLRAKQDAGADFVILNHAGSADDALAFAAATRGDGVDFALMAPVPVMTDRQSVDALTRFPGVRLPASDLARLIDATDPVEAGIDFAVASARRLMAGGLIAGVNLSGIATGAGPRRRSEIMREIASRLTTASTNEV